MLEEQSRQVFQKIWDKVAKPGQDGRKWVAIKNREDLEYHWWSGLVDDDRFTREQWVSAFQESLLPNGGYLVNEDQWMDKAKYHYAGPILPPYDPNSIREGEWIEAELEDLVWKQLKPCVYFTNDEWRRIVAEVKKSLPKKNGNFVIGAALKQEWTSFVNTYASPRRVLQMGVQQLREAQKAQAAASPSGGSPSGFAQGASHSRNIADRLSQLIGKRS